MDKKCDYIAYDENSRNDLGPYQAVSTPTEGERPNKSPVHNIIESEERSGRYNYKELTDDEQRQFGGLDSGFIAQKETNREAFIIWSLELVSAGIRHTNWRLTEGPDW